MAFFHEYFRAGVKVAGLQQAVALHEVAVESQQQGLTTTLDAIDWANELPNGDEYKARAVALFKQGLVEQAETIQIMLQRPLPPKEKLAEELSLPFDQSRTIETPSPAALTQDGNDPAPKKRMGRPKGSKNKARVEEPPQPVNESPTLPLESNPEAPSEVKQ
jgi:hypothetical protein